MSPTPVAKTAQASAVDWEDLIWLKISDARSNFVSSGVLFFRGECNEHTLHAEVRRAFADYPKLLAFPAPAEDGRLHWQARRDFDPVENVTVRALPASVWEQDGRLVMDAALSETLHQLVGRTLPSTRPLWELVLITGLRYREAPAFCLAFTTHHSVADGVAYYDILANLCRHPDRGQHHVRALTVPHRTLASHLARWVWSLGYVLRLLLPEPRTPLVERGPAGQALMSSAAQPLARVLAVARREAISVNALAIAALAVALGHASQARLRAPLRRVRAVLPVSVHTRDEDTHELVNKMGYFHATLDLGELDPIVIARSIDAQLRTCKRHGYDRLMRRVARVAAAAPTPLTKLMHRFFASRASIVISCFPFPSTPLELGEGRAVNIGAFPVIPKPLRLSAMLVTHGGTLTLYLHSNQPRHDLAGIARCFAETLERMGDLGELASASSAPAA